MQQVRKTLDDKKELLSYLGLWLLKILILYRLFTGLLSELNVFRMVPADTSLVILWSFDLAILSCVIFFGFLRRDLSRHAFFSTLLFTIFLCYVALEIIRTGLIADALGRAQRGTVFNLRLWVFFLIMCVTFYAVVAWVRNFWLLKNFLLFLVGIVLLEATMGVLEGILWYSGQKDLVMGLPWRRYIFYVSDGTKYHTDMFRSSGSFYNPAVYGSFLASGLPLLYPIYKEAGSTFKRALIVLCGLFVVLAIGFSYSRSGVVGLGAGIAVLILLVAKRPREVLQRGNIVIAIVFLLFLFTIVPGMWARVMSIFNFQDPSVLNRLRLIHLGASLLALSPFIGLGAGTTYFYYDVFFKFPHVKYSYYNMHSTPMTLLVEYGIIGFAIFLLFVIVLLGQAFRRTRKAYLPYLHGMCAALVTMGVCSVFDNYWSISPMLLLFLYVAGLLTVLPKLSVQERLSDETCN